MSFADLLNRALCFRGCRVYGALDSEVTAGNTQALSGWSGVSLVVQHPQMTTHVRTHLPTCPIVHVNKLTCDQNPFLDAISHSRQAL